MTTGRSGYSRVPTTFDEDYIVPSQQELLPELDFETEYANLQHKHLRGEATQPPVPKQKLRESPAVRDISPVIRSGMRQRKKCRKYCKRNSI